MKLHALGYFYGERDSNQRPVIFEIVDENGFTLIVFVLGIGLTQLFRGNLYLLPSENLFIKETNYYSYFCLAFFYVNLKHHL